MTDRSKLSPSELSRYSRHILLDQIGVEGQERLSAASVLIVGTGGLGSPAALYLAAAGVGTLGLADFDRVEEHNLQRQILHGTSAVGLPKLESAARTLREVNPFVDLRLHEQGITPDNAAAIFAEYDVILDGTDNFATRFLNNDAAHFSGKPLVYGSIFKFEGQVTVFDTRAGGPCYRCLFPEPPPPGSIPTCGEAGVIGALCGVVGSLQAIEVLKLLVGFGEPLRGRLLNYNALTQTFQTLTLPRDPGCPLCGSSPSIRALDTKNYSWSCEPAAVSSDGTFPLEITVAEARAWLRDDPTGTELIDVREPYEWEIARIPGARLIPMREIPERLPELSREKRLLLQCHHGGRSLRVTEYLRTQGYSSVTNVGGGIDAWALEIDSSLRRY